MQQQCGQECLLLNLLQFSSRAAGVSSRLLVLLQPGLLTWQQHLVDRVQRLVVVNGHVLVHVGREALHVSHLHVIAHLAEQQVVGGACKWQQQAAACQGRSQTHPCQHDAAAACSFCAGWDNGCCLAAYAINGRAILGCQCALQ